MNTDRPVWREIDPDDWTVDGIGRVYRHRHGPQKGQWFWSCFTDGDREHIAHTGAEDTLEKARAAVRNAHDALIASRAKPR